MQESSTGQRRALRLHVPGFGCELACSLTIFIYLAALMGEAGGRFATTVCLQTKPFQEHFPESLITSLALVLSVFDWICETWKDIPQARFYITTVLWLDVALRISCCLPS